MKNGAKPITGTPQCWHIGHTNIVHMSQILPHFFVSNPRTRQECYKLVKAEILKLAPNICYFTQLLKLDIAIVKIYYRLSSDLYRKYVLSLL